MREIKFRAWDIDLKKISKPFSIGHTLNFTNEKGLGFMKSYDAVIHDLMQYTGLKDRNGKEICEGDIVKSWEVEMTDMFTETNIECDERISAVYFDQDLAGFAISYDHKRNMPLCHRDVFEVIGNIYENPELLK